MAETKIEWADRVWNPVVGCTPVNEGCRNCYAKPIFERFHPGEKFSQVRCLEERLDQPLHWKKPARVFVNSMSDLFHPDVPMRFLAGVFNTMASWRLVCKQQGCDHTQDGCTEDPGHIFMILTKRPERMKSIITELLPRFVSEIFSGDSPLSLALETDEWPLKNVWMGVSVENQKAADERIPLLLETPAAMRFVSCEPLLGPVNLEPYLQYPPFHEHYKMTWGVEEAIGVDWVICGGESGPKARPMHPDWARGLRDQCQAAGVPFFFKQWGEWGSLEDHRGIEWMFADPKTGFFAENYPGDTEFVCGGASSHGQHMVKVGKKSAGRLLNGREWNEFPPSPLAPLPQAGEGGRLEEEK